MKCDIMNKDRLSTGDNHVHTFTSDSKISSEKGIFTCVFDVSSMGG